MLTETRSAAEILSLLKPYLRTQSVTVVVTMTNTDVVAGILETIEAHQIQVKDGALLKVLPLNEIKQITHSRLLELQLQPQK